MQRLLRNPENKVREKKRLFTEKISENFLFLLLLF